jgi:5-methylcytosine-specific restriction enzyme B
VSPLGVGNASLTKHYHLDQLPALLAQVQPGVSTETDVEQLLEGIHAELANDLVTYAADGTALDDALLRACRNNDADTPLLVWVGLAVADRSLQEVIDRDLTDGDGRLDHARFNAGALKAALSLSGGKASDKSATNILRWFEQAGVVEADRQANSVIGIKREFDTAGSVPKIVEYLGERLGRLGAVAATSASTVDLAIALGANQWVNLSGDEFRAAAAGATPPQAVKPRTALPPQLGELHEEIGRKRQVLVKGPPGTGKTYLAKEYATWLTASDGDQSRVLNIVSTLPQNARTPDRVAEEIINQGLPAAWELVVFHPSQSYERFVRGLQAEPVAGGVTFTPHRRTFDFLLEVAHALEARGSDAELLLVIDEINRADLGKVFGELIYSLEYRGEPAASIYAIDGDATLTVPERLLILGTMNTADRSIAFADFAFIRRWVHIKVRPDRVVIANSPNFAGSDDRAAALRIFDRISQLFDNPQEPELRELRVGHSYCLPEREQTDTDASLRLLARKFVYEMLALLSEYEQEGHLPPGTVQTLLSEFGAPDPYATEPHLVDQVSAFLAAPLPPDPAPPAATSSDDGGDGDGGDGDDGAVADASANPAAPEAPPPAAGA